MRRHLLPVCLGIVLALGNAAAATETNDVMQPIRHFVDAINTGDVPMALKTCASPASIIDEFPPYTWSGTHACADWFAAFAADDKRRGKSNDRVTLAKSAHVDVMGDRAYVIVGATYTWMQQRKALAEDSAHITLSLHKSNGAWRITGWAWSKV